MGTEDHDNAKRKFYEISAGQTTNKEQINRIFRKSGLYKPEEDDKK